MGRGLRAGGPGRGRERRQRGLRSGRAGAGGGGGGAGAGCEAGISQPRMGDGDPGGKWPESEPLEGRLRE